MKQSVNQQGAGMMEVLVALLLLSIGVLGFIALQYRAVDAGGEALVRTQAMGLAKELGERIRANQFALASYASGLNTASAATVTKCLGTQKCSSIDMAAYDVSDIQSKAEQLGLQIKMPKCDSAAGKDRYCIYVAWGKTKPIESTSDGQACTKGGIYLPTAKCVIMETYQ